MGSDWSGHILTVWKTSNWIEIPPLPRQIISSSQESTTQPHFLFWLPAFHTSISNFNLHSSFCPTSNLAWIIKIVLLVYVFYFLYFQPWNHIYILEPKMQHHFSASHQWNRDTFVHNASQQAVPSFAFIYWHRAPCNTCERRHLAWLRVCVCVSVHVTHMTTRAAKCKNANLFSREETGRGGGRGEGTRRRRMPRRLNLLRVLLHDRLVAGCRGAARI